MAPKSPKKMRLVLLDAHAIIHRAYHALPEFSSSKGEPTGALYGISTMLMKITADLKPDYVVAAYDLPGKTFRHESYDEYKAGRMKAADDLVAQLKSSRKIFDAFNIPIYDCPGFEADDVLGTITENLKKDKGTDIVIASGDMDTLQLVDNKKVQVFTLKKGLNDTIMYDEDKVNERFGFGPELLPDYKGLRGDPSDNIIGIKGIGEKTATILIQKFGTIESIYKELNNPKSKFDWKALGITERIVQLLKDNEEEALFSKTLATIRRDAPINFKLPTQKFSEAIDINKIEALFKELEFKSLLTRVKNLFGIKQTESEKEEEVRKSEEVVDEQELLETSIALWIINSDIVTPSLEDILDYSKKKTFAEAKQFIFDKLKADDLQKVYDEIEKPIIPIIREMEKTGILIDKDFFKKIAKDYHKKLDVLTSNIYKLAGGEFNINSPKQLSEVLFDKMGLKTKGKRGVGGSFSTKVEILEELEEGNPIITEIMQYRELQKLLSTYIDIIPEMAGADNRLHAKFIQHGSTTGRFSSNNPNLQNIPIKSELGRAIRSGFIAPKGKKLVAFDYSQIELRVVAMMSGDKNLTQIFEEGKDVHSGVASFVFGVPQDKVDAEMRRKAKVINFGILYGMGVSALRKNLGGTRDEAEQFYNNYFTQFSGVREFLNDTKVFAEKHMYTETLFGRRRQFPNIRSAIPFIKVMAERTATNAPLQGTAADIIKLAIYHADLALTKAGLKDEAKLILQIHDELVYEVDDKAVEKASAVIKAAMEGVMQASFIKYATKIPLIVHYGVGSTMGELK